MLKALVTQTLNIRNYNYLTGTEGRLLLLSVTDFPCNECFALGNFDTFREFLGINYTNETLTTDRFQYRQLFGDF